MARQKKSELKELRNRVGNMYGAKLAKKASAAFCEAFGRPVATAVGLEFAPQAGHPLSVVLEFVSPTDVLQAIQGSVAELRKSSAWAQMSKALAKAKFPAVGLSGLVTEVAESGRSEPELLPLKNFPLLRFVEISALRDNFAKIVSPIVDEIERRAATVESQVAEGMAALRLPVTTQVCWLNRTARAVVDPYALAEVASDDSVERVDIPRRIEPELSVSALTVGAPQFRTKTGSTGKGIIVAVIDSEVAPTHPALKGRVVHKKNFTLEPWGNTGSHGTAVAGIIGSNDANFTGVAPEATIYNYKVIASNPALNSDDFDGAMAIQRAVEDGAHVANCSWGNGPAGDGTSREARACDAAWSLGLVVVKSAGNKGPGARSLTTPAEAAGVIAVGATDRKGKAVQDYSSRGPAKTGPRPHLIAPGGSFTLGGIISCLTGGGFGDCGVGTSFAAPHVSGLVALLLDEDPSRSPDDCRAILLKRCRRLPRVPANTQGAGLVKI